ncbi:MAG: transporter substrate-binding domain-containing protein [Bacteroidetes bacterium]|nr:transporter substrate-binding domain-containing protein [Bacteroidota bacterium]
MRRIIKILALIVLAPWLAFSQDTLKVFYFENSPLAYSEANIAKGIEIDILNEFIVWIKTNKKFEGQLKYIPLSHQNDFTNSLPAAGKNAISASANVFVKEKQNNFDYTSPYLKNVSFCITNGNSGDIKTKNASDLIKVLGTLSAVTVTNTSISKAVLELKKNYINDLKIKTVETQEIILNEIAKSVLNFGYVNVFQFWSFLKANPSKFLKVQKALTISNEELVFVINKGSPLKAQFDEFFMKFKITKNYRSILEKHVGAYLSQTMAIN